MWAVIASFAGPVVLFWPPLLVWLFNARRSARAEALAKEQAAYADLLTSSIGMASRAQTLLTVLKQRSGLGEALSLALRIRDPVDPLALHDWIDRDFSKVMDAWSRVWVHGSAEGVLLGNRLVASCGELMELLSAARATTTIQQKAWHLIVGVRAEHVAREWQQRMRAISVARRDLAEYIRSETGRPPAALFSLPTSETSTPAPQPAVDRTSQGAEPA